MVGVLIRMKLAVIRNSMTGGKAAWMVITSIVGALLGLATIIFSLFNTAAAPDVLAAVYLTVLLGWTLGPLLAGTSVLKPEHFTLLSISRRRLAVGLLGAAFVGVGPAVSLLILLSMVPYGARLGLLQAILAVPAVGLTLVLVVLLSRVAASVVGRLAKARTGATVVGAMVGAVIVLAQSGWMLVVGIIVSGVLEEGFPAALSLVLRAFPSGWGLAAVEAAGRGEWLLALGMLAGTVVVIIALLLVWSRTLGASRIRVTIRGSRRARPARRGPLATPTGAVLRKELRTWRRDPYRAQAIAVPLVWAFGTALLPLTFGSTALMPWAAPGLALMSAVAMVNLYGDSGTALWLTLQTSSERVDVRGRQWAQFLVFGPIVALVAVCFTIWSGMDWAWPWVLALTPALLGGGIGLVTWLSVKSLVPGPDPHKRAGGQDHGDVTVQAYAIFMLGGLPAIPAVGVLVAGALLDNAPLLWSAVPVGIASGAFLAWWLGQVAYRHLQRRGPEMLFLMRTARRSEPVEEEQGEDQPTLSYSTNKLMFSVVGWVLGPVALIPQGVVPIVILLGDSDTRSWFLALYLPESLQWPAAISMMLIGAVLTFLAIWGSIPGRKPAASSEAKGSEPVTEAADTPATDSKLESV